MRQLTLDPGQVWDLITSCLCALRSENLQPLPASPPPPAPFPSSSQSPHGVSPPEDFLPGMLRGY